MELGADVSDRPYGDGHERRRLVTVRSAYSEIVVDEMETARYLWFGHARQAGVRLRDGAFDFGVALASSQRSFDLADLYQPSVASVLHVGLGAGNAAMRSALRHPDAVVEVVEIDPAVVDVAVEWFGFDPDRCRVHLADAFAFLRSADASWDRVMVDAFLSEGGTSQVNVYPSYFGESDFIDLLAGRVAADGLLMANLNGSLRGPSSDRLLRLLDFIERAFGHLAVHSVADRTGEGYALAEHPDLELPDDHYIALAGRRRLPSVDEIRTRAEAAEGGAYVDPKIVAFAANRIDAWRP